MGLFDQILGAVNNPGQQGSPDQLGSILNAVQQVTGSQGLDPSVSQTVMSMVGGYVRSSLQQQRSTGGNSQVEAIVNQFGGTDPSTAALQALFPAEQQQQLADAIAQRTGLDANLVLSMLPSLVPIALNFLKTGTSTQAEAGTGGGSNSVLNSFLDADGDGDVDLGDTLSMAGRYLNR